MSILLRITATVTIATFMAALGMAMIDQGSPGLVVPVSIGMWLLLAILLSGLPVLAGAYIGMISPFIGGILFGPGILVVLLNPIPCCFVGTITGMMVSVIWRIDFEEEY